MIESLPGSMVHIAQLVANRARPRLTMMKRVMRKMAAKLSERLSTRELLATVRLRREGSSYRDTMVHLKPLN